MDKKIQRRATRLVRIGDLRIGAGEPIAVQSMCATKTQNVKATLEQIKSLEEHGAALVRVAVDGRRDVEALKEIASQVKVPLSVDIQESYQLIPQVAPFVQKIRYNPGHMYHHQKTVSVREKVRGIVNVARQYELALRIGVNFGSLDPEQLDRSSDGASAALASVSQHVEMMEEFGFSNYVVSLKSSDPREVVKLNTLFADKYPFVPLHLGVTEAGLLPMGEVKSRAAFEPLLLNGIGDTLRVSLTLPWDRKDEEIVVGQRIIDDVYQGRGRANPAYVEEGLNIVSCPSCSRVENERFVELAEKVRDLSQFAAKERLTIAVMGCRVNGPGETDDADLGLWCAPNHVNFKRRGELLGAFSYDEILQRVEEELRALISKGE